MRLSTGILRSGQKLDSKWENKFKKGDNIILAAFGGGFTWGAVYLKWAY